MLLTMEEPYEDPLDAVFDVLVLGTGLPSSIAAAALAQQGKTVCHIDALEFYGEDTASFQLSQLISVAKEHQCTTVPPARHPPASDPSADTPVHDIPASTSVGSDDKEGMATGTGAGMSDAAAQLAPLESPFELSGNSCFVEPAPNVTDWEVQFHGVDAVPESLARLARDITIDLLPSLTLARGAMIDALIRSKVAESYLEFVMLQATGMAEMDEKTMDLVLRRVCVLQSIFALVIMLYKTASSQIHSQKSN
jgi:RAB protein geranylgeranyltransferase component A